jgi:hypothetical protein
MWIESSKNVFTYANGSVGLRFNVTVWLNMSVDVLAVQVALHYNRTQLKCTQAEYTIGAIGEYFSGHTILAVGPFIDTGGLGNGSIGAVETCYLPPGDYVSGPHSGSLLWAEFEILCVPTNGDLTSKFDISTEYQAGNTFVLDPTGWNMIPLTPFDGDYLFLDRSMFAEFNSFVFTQEHVRVIYPSDNPSKPLGRHWASTSDWTASAYVTTKLSPYIWEGLDTSIYLVDQTSGNPIAAPGIGIASLGGPIVNVPVYYYEVNKIAPVIHVDTPGARGPGEPWSLWYYKNGTSITATAAGIDEHNDFFLVEVFRDGGGRNVLLAYGISGKGTYAAGKYFNSALFPDIASNNLSWIIVKWNDTNNDGFVNGPNDGDAYTVIASGS